MFHIIILPASCQGTRLGSAAHFAGTGVVAQG
jgi:hypothetical protein